MSGAVIFELGRVEVSFIDPNLIEGLKKYNYLR